MKPKFERLNPETNRQIELMIDKFLSKNSKSSLNQSLVDDWLQKKKFYLKFKTTLVVLLFEKIEIQREKIRQSQILKQQFMKDHLKQWQRQKDNQKRQSQL